jgi:hypothetical protein
VSARSSLIVDVFNDLPKGRYGRALQPASAKGLQSYRCCVARLKAVPFPSAQDDVNLVVAAQFRAENP